MKNKYYALEQSGREANITIYGDITSWEWFESDVSSYTLAKQIDGLDVDTINVYLNSYGGEVAEGLAIYANLKRHKARVRTHCDGFACSIASVIFMAGDERIVYPTSLLMVHNAWTYTSGNAQALRKEADTLETVTQASINAYLEGVNISEEELKALLDEETWLTAQDAFEKGFATSIAQSTTNGPSQRARLSFRDMVGCRNSLPSPPTPTPAAPEAVATVMENKLLKLLAALAPGEEQK